MGKVQRYGWILTILILFPAISTVVAARQVEKVRFVGPDGGVVYQIHVVPEHPSVIYVLDERVLFKSTDAGTTWRDITPASTGGARIPALYMAHDGPNTLFLVAEEGTVVRSNDAGETWQAYYADPLYEVFFIDPDRPDTLLAYDTHGPYQNILMRSTDGGVTWQASVDGIDLDGKSIRVFVNRYETTHAIATVQCCGDVFTSQAVYTSTDGGRHWVPTETGVRFIEEVVFDPADPNTLYAMPQEGLHKSTDGGHSWFDIGAALPQSYFRHLAVGPGIDDPGSSTLYYVPRDEQGGLSHPLYRSIDGGVTWQQTGTVAPIVGVAAFAVHPQSRQDLFAGGYPYGLLHSSDGGQTWEIRNEGLSLSRVHTVSARSPDEVLAIVDERGVMHTSDGGQTWEVVIPYTLGIGTGKRIVRSLENPQHLFTNIIPDSLRTHDPDWHTGSAGIGISRDGGRTWEFRQGARTGLSCFDVSDDGTIIYGGSPFDALSKSTDGGNSWEVILLDPSVESVRQLQVDPRDTEVVYARMQVPCACPRSTHPLVRSTDGGRTWETLVDDVATYFLNKLQPEYLYYVEPEPGGTGTFYVSEDRGATWTPATTFPDASGLSDLIVHPEQAEVLYAAMESGSILRSEDNGHTWASVIERFYPPAYAIALAVANPSVLFGTTYERGVVRFDLASLEPTSADPEPPSAHFRLTANYPNPFHGATTIAYEVAEPAVITLRIVDVLGRHIRTLVQQAHSLGRHRLRWDSRDASGHDVPSGLYFVEMSAEGIYDVRKLVLVR